MNAVARKRRFLYSIVVLTLLVVAVAWISRPLSKDEVAALLDLTTIPRLALKNATFEESINEVLARAAEQDTRVHHLKKEIYPDLRSSPEPPGSIPGLDEAPPAPVLDENGVPIVGGPYLTINLTNVPASEALKYVSSLSNYTYTIRPGMMGFTQSISKPFPHSRRSKRPSSAGTFSSFVFMSP